MNENTPLHTTEHLPQILDVRQAAKTAVFEIQAVDLRFANGTERTYERLTPARRPAVMILPLLADSLLMIREYAVGTERYELTFPKGLIDEGETPEEAANRELQEETGHAARRFTLLHRLYTSPGHMYSPLYVFAAQELYPSERTGDEPEPLQQTAVPAAALHRLLNNPELGDARVLAALFVLRERGLLPGFTL